MRYNIDEILAMAEKIERNGAAFYRRGAAIARDPAVKKLMGELASWEEGHEALFKHMRGRLSGSSLDAYPDDEGQAELYLSALGSIHVFGPDKTPEEILTGGEDTAEILLLALHFEADSINFFAALKALLPQAEGTEHIDALIQEELGHVAYLERARRRLTTTP